MGHWDRPRGQKHTVTSSFNLSLLPPEGNDLHLALLSPPKLPLHSGKSSQHGPFSLASGPVCLSTWLSSPELSTGTVDRSVPWPPRLRTVPCPLTLDARHPHSHVLPWPSGINPRDPTSDLEAGHSLVYTPGVHCALRDLSLSLQNPLKLLQPLTDSTPTFLAEYLDMVYRQIGAKTWVPLLPLLHTPAMSNEGQTHWDQLSPR